MSSSRLRVLDVLLAAATSTSVFVAARPALGAFHVPGGTALVAAAAGGSALVALLGARILRLAPAASYLLSLIGLVVLLLVADGPHGGAVAAALERGPSRVLTETLPLTGSRAAASSLVVVVWVCGAAMSEILIRARRRPAVAPLAIPPALYALCFGLSSTAPRPDRVGGPLLLVTLSITAALQMRIAQPASEEPDLGRRRLPAGIAVCASLAAGLAIVAPSVPPLRGAPVGLHRHPPTDSPVITDPVASIADLRRGPPRALMTAKLSTSSVGYLAMAYLDGYDGAHWRFAATFQPTGGRVPTSPAAGNGPAVTQQIEISGPLPVPLLPALDRPVSVTGAAVADDPTTGMLLPQGAQRGDTYTVVSRASAVSLPELAPADGIDPSLGGAFDLQTPPDTAADLAIMMRYLSTLDGGAHPAGTVAFLQSALHALQTDERRIDPAAGGSPGESGLAGTSLSEVIDAVTVDHAATPEQLATFLALIARELGVPARVATGFRLAGSSDGRLVGPGTYRVTSRQAWAWVEIPVAGVGWVVCDPAPDAATTAASPVPESESAPATTLPPRPAEAIPRSQVTAGHALAPPTHLAAPRPRRGSAWIVVASVASGLALMLVSGGPAAAALRRWRRRRRRRSTDPSALAVGAWLELLDGLDRAGMSCSSASTASEVARETGHHFGSDFVQPAAMVAALADRAVFSTTARIGPREALEAWDRVRELRRQLRAGLDVRQRIRYSLLVGSAPSRPSATAAD